jgi:hypothetical protein
MDESNFFIDTNGRMCVVDFENVGLLPEFFASYTVHVSSDPFVMEVAQYLDWPRSPNLDSMIRASVILRTISDPTLGTSTFSCHRILTNNGDRHG